jgi:hypothetical protein
MATHYVGEGMESVFENTFLYILHKISLPFPHREFQTRVKIIVFVFFPSLLVEETLEHLKRTHLGCEIALLG